MKLSLVCFACAYACAGLEQAGLTFYHLNKLQDVYRSQESSVVEVTNVYRTVVPGSSAGYVFLPQQKCYGQNGDRVVAREVFFTRT